jgi:methylated-DNA-protein-cysteine methyltransferase related protein
MNPDAYRDAVLELVAQIPPGRVMSYGAIAECLAERSGRGSPRLIGGIMARCNRDVPWHRVIRANGRPAAGLEERALALLRAEGTPMLRGRVDMRRASWAPPPPA